uniref:Uncharacterized protein n=1 Tax=Arundo donax TaxID=35708 RepID=A0A0A8Z4A7_ARUDO
MKYLDYWSNMVSQNQKKKKKKGHEGFTIAMDSCNNLNGKGISSHSSCNISPDEQNFYTPQDFVCLKCYQVLSS